MSSYLPPSPNPIFNSKSFNTNDILINIDGLTSSARAYIDEKIEDISGDITDLSGIIITIIEDIESNTSQIQTNVSAISIIGGEIDTLETNTAKLNADNTFTENNTFSGDKQFIVNITGSPTSAITFAGREVNIQDGLLCGNGPTAHIDAKISGVLSVNQTAQGGTDDRALNYITTPKVEITTAPVDLTDATTKNYVDTEVATKQDTIIQATNLPGFNMTSTASLNFLSSGTASGNLNFFNPTNQLDVQQLNFGVIEGIGTQLSTLSSSVDNLALGKQDNLTAGTGIDITNNIISSTGGGGGSSIEIFQISMVRNNGTTALSNNANLPFAIIDKETSGLTMSATSTGEVTFGGSNVAGTYEIKYSMVLSNIASTTNRVIIRGYVNNVWVVEFGKLSGLLENGSFTYDFASGDVLRFSIIGLQGSNQLLLATGLTTETYASCFLTGIKLI